MTFDARESSRQDGAPIALFLIRYGAAVANYYALTNHEEIVSYGGIDYLPVGASHSSIKRMLTLDDVRLILTLPSTHELATRWRGYPPSEVTSLVIRQGHVGDNDFKVVWLGRVLGHADKQEGESEFTCEPRMTALGRNSLNRNWQYGCPHLLYSQGPGRCNADKDAATTEFPVVVAFGGMITLGPGWLALGAARLDYVKGMAEWTTADQRYESRTIIGIEEDTGVITLSGPATGLIGGMTVKMVLGCNHAAFAPDGDCERLHNNVPNYGGQPYIPLTNPLGLKNGFY